jgi:hypothetical protein
LHVYVGLASVVIFHLRISSGNELAVVTDKEQMGLEIISAQGTNPWAKLQLYHGERGMRKGK